MNCSVNGVGVFREYEYGYSCLDGGAVSTGSLAHSLLGNQCYREIYRPNGGIVRDPEHVIRRACGGFVSEESMGKRCFKM